MNKNKMFYSLLVIVLLAGNVFLYISCSSSRREVGEARILLAREKMNSQKLGFMRIFIDKVLQANQEVDFETRLDLENRVRDLQSPAILDQWNRFTKSATEADAQVEVKKLLLLLIDETQAAKK